MKKSGQTPPRRGGRRKVFTHCLANDDPEGCSEYKKGRFCAKHRGQYYSLHIIDINGRRLREPHRGGTVRFKGCIAVGAGHHTKHMKGRFCERHWMQFYKGIIDKEGRKKRLLKGEVLCGIPWCGRRGGWKTGLCRKHYDAIVVNQSFGVYNSLMKAPSKIRMTEEETVWSDDFEVST